MAPLAAGGCVLRGREPARKRLGPHDGAWRARTLNPYADGGTLDLEAVLKAFEAETGIALQIPLEAVRERLRTRVPAGVYADGVAVSRSVEEDQDVRGLLRDLLEREFILKPDNASCVFELQAILRAPLLHIQRDGGERRVVANVGAGRVLQADICTYPGEAARPVREWRGKDRDAPHVLDGGNIRIAVTARLNANLEGTVLRSVHRRRQEEADDYYYDDDPYDW